MDEAENSLNVGDDERGKTQKNSKDWDNKMTPMNERDGRGWAERGVDAEDEKHGDDALWKARREAEAVDARMNKDTGIDRGHD